MPKTAQFAGALGAGLRHRRAHRAEGVGALNHTLDDGEAMRQAVREVMDRGGTPLRARSPEEIEALFAGTRLLEPGVVSCSRWRPDPSPWREPEVPHFSGVSVL